MKVPYPSGKCATQKLCPSTWTHPLEYCELHADLDIRAVNLDGKGRQLDRTVADILARANVVFPHVPRATDYFALEHAFAQRAV
jgi:hypothetical protein